jgi:NAD(P)-dependent dehydrogenase (short-subunit alcohol dehydrogenase family)
MGRLDGRIALVTGASRGIGAAIAKRFAAEGAHLVLVARTKGGLEEVDDEIRKAGGAATLLPLDLAEHEKIDQMAYAIHERFGRLDILVGNAALLAARFDVAGMNGFIGADSLAFISIDGLYRAMGSPEGRDALRPRFCDACFTGDYPIPLLDHQAGKVSTQLSLLAEPA